MGKGEMESDRSVCGRGDRGLRRYEKLRSGREEKRRKVLVGGGDFNARTDRKRGRVEEEEVEE